LSNLEPADLGGPLEFGGVAQSVDEEGDHALAVRDSLVRYGHAQQGDGLPMTHLALAFAIAHPGVTSAITGPHTMEQLDDLLAGADVTLTDDILDQIDEIVPPGTDVGTLDQAYLPPALVNPSLRRRPASERTAA